MFSVSFGSALTSDHYALAADTRTQRVLYNRLDTRHNSHRSYHWMPRKKRCVGTVRRVSTLRQSALQEMPLHLYWYLEEFLDARSFVTMRRLCGQFCGLQAGRHYTLDLTAWWKPSAAIPEWAFLAMMGEACQFARRYNANTVSLPRAVATNTMGRWFLFLSGYDPFAAAIV